MENEQELIDEAMQMTSTQIAYIIKELTDELKNRVLGLVKAKPLREAKSH